MGYEPRVGDVIEVAVFYEDPAYRSVITRRDFAFDDSRRSHWLRPDGRPAWLADFLNPSQERYAPLRPDNIGQRVRNADGLCGTTIEGRSVTVQWDDGWCSTHKPDALVRIADKAEPSGRAENKPIPTAAAPTDAWPNRPQCGRPGHDPACLCSTGWVRPVEAEPKVHETWATRDGGRWVEATRNPARPRLYERAYVVNGGPLMPTRELAIAAWRARHG